MIPLPALAAGDVYLFAHANGAISLRYADGRSMLVPLDEAVAVAEGCHAAGSEVVVGWEDVPIAATAIGRIREAGVPLDVFDLAAPPQAWPDGTDALIEAAAHGSDRVLDDLLVRGADPHHRDVSGSTALHHAAANGSVHAVGALVAAGAEVDAVNGQGFTPLHLARACREPEAVTRLVELGADPSAPTDADGPVRFSHAHAGTAYVWLLPAAFVVAAAVGFWPLTPLGAAALVAFAAAVAGIAPPRAFWAGGIPRQLDGTVLSVRAPFGRTRTIDLADVTVAGIGGSTGRAARLGARWLLLGHPDGVPVTRRSLRRLLVPAADLDALAERLDRAVVVPIAGGRTAEVLRPVGNALSGLGVDLSASLRAQLERARAVRPR